MEYQFSTNEAEARFQKREVLEGLGEVYPSSAAPTHTIIEALDQFDTLSLTNEMVTVVGRVRAKRVHGGSMFVVVQDFSRQLQLFVSRAEIGEDSYEQLESLIDPADFIEATGTLMLTKKGEKTLAIKSWRLITKAVLPLPEKWHGLTDTETRFRRRYLDILMNDEVKARIVARSRIISAMRNFLNSQGFIEVETPTLQPIYGGGFAKPFKTHHNALDADFFLRISDEMYLKRLLVGSFEKVYEITKVFRNEGIDHDHNPEFTMFEAQIAYKDYNYGMDLFEELYENAAQNALGATEIQHDGVTVSVARPWTRMKMVDSILKIGGVNVTFWTSVDQAKQELMKTAIDPKKFHELDHMKTLGECIAFAFEELVEEKLIQPTIIYDYPVEVSPLAKKCVDDPRFTQRFEAFALGSEIGNNYSELNDPVDLEQRFIEEKKKEAAGFDEAHQTDYDYLEAIKHGMPPACGLGIGIDRMIMLLTGVNNIKEVIIFPTLRPQNNTKAEE